MTQAQLDREVATVLGEDIREIRRRGFSVADPAEVNFDPEPEDLLDRFFDWDKFDAKRNVPLMPQRSTTLGAA